jgi:superfamily I DNA/RNA helicase
MSMPALTETTPAARVWSPQQQEIFAFIEDETKRHGVVEALAGTGKTTTIVEAVRHTCDGDSVAVFAFNKSIATELQSRKWPDGVEISTFHSFGLRVISSAHGRREVDARACSNRVKSVIDTTYDVRRAIEKLVSFAKGTLADATIERDRSAQNHHARASRVCGQARVGAHRGRHHRTDRL